jgi:hypothetical protein
MNLERKNPQKSPKYFCEICNLHTSNKKDFGRHLLTAKHQNMGILNKSWVDENEKSPKIPKLYSCEFCNKEYKSPSGLWNHRRKTCLAPPLTQTMSTATPTVLENTITPNNMFEVIINIVKSNEDIKCMMVEQMKQQIESQKIQTEQNLETQRQLIELVKEPRTTTNTQNNNFNIHFFLNETCKDAINVSEFIENIKIDFTDVENVGAKGYVTGITDMILKNLKDLGMTKRPFHCTDLKRETIYIKDNDKWDKDNETKEKFQRVLNQIYNKNWNVLRNWSKANPDISKLDSRENKLYHKILEQTDCIKGLDKLPVINEKIIKKLSETIKVERTV